METISGSSSSSIKSLVSDDFEYDLLLLEEVECLSSWELVDAFDAEKVHGSVNDRVGSDIQNAILHPQSPGEFIVHDHSDDLCHEDNIGYGSSVNLEDKNGNSFGDEYEDEDEDENVGDVSDLDEELVSWSVSCKFERQKMRKLERRLFPKMFNSRSPHLLPMPGCAASMVLD